MVPSGGSIWATTPAVVVPAAGLVESAALDAEAVPVDLRMPDSAVALVDRRY